jgi:uroporphyrinogen-III synthase
MAALQGVTVLVTRPERQAGPLCGLLEVEGATVIRLPALDIKPLSVGPELLARIGPLDAFDLVVFTSANAVHFGSFLVEGRGPAPPPALAAIGPATARAMQRLGLVAITPTDGFDSERLLELPVLASPLGRRILIVKGSQGRELLQDRLIAGGGQVVVAEVYQRARAVYDEAELSALCALTGSGIDVVTATSVDVAVALLDIVTPQLREQLERVHWLVPSARVAAAVRARGLSAPLIQATSAEDHDLVAAIKRWRSSG